MNNKETKNVIKPIGRMKLTKRIKLNKGTDFFPATLKLFHRKERSDILLGIEVKDCDQTREKMKKKKTG